MNEAKEYAHRTYELRSYRGIARKSFQAGYDAGQRDAIAAFRRRVEERVGELIVATGSKDGILWVQASAEVEKEMNKRG